MPRSTVSLEPTRHDAARAVPIPPGPIGLFLDFDGTLIDFAPTPDEVRADPALIDLLARLSVALRGAVAIVSGRRIATLDALLAPLRLPTAGLHGLEWRSASGARGAAPPAPPWLDALRAPLSHHVAAHPGLWLEDKGPAVAVHFRRAPQHAAATRARLQALLRGLPEEASLLEGDAVLELRPRTHDKGSAVDALLREPPFQGRLPLYLGDDVTDATGFAAVARHGGVAIAVGERLSAAWRLAGPATVREWLALVVATRAIR